MLTTSKRSSHWTRDVLGWHWVIILAIVRSFCWIMAGIIFLIDCRKEKRAYKTYQKSKRRPAMFNVLKKFIEEKLNTTFTEEDEALYSPLSDQVNLDSIYSAIASFIKETEYSVKEISVGDSSNDQKVEMSLWKGNNFFRLKIYYAGNMMAIQFY